ncbi:MAG TPA: tRNA (adenosine(37)-N6)-threonylcarbamoyltransferase complex dimerization subunit type 1 TsaB [Solirubrobacterales bacterium]
MSGSERNVLALDAATDDVVVGIARGGRMLREASIAPSAGERPRHSTALLAEIEAAVEAGGGWSRVGRIGIGIGPGSYTGLRIGIATGRSLAQARGIPAVGIPTLTALALGIAARAGDPSRLCLAVADARRAEVFAQLHDGSGAPITGPAVLDPARLGDWLADAGGSAVADADEPPLSAGSGAVRFRRELDAARVETLADGDPAHRLAARHLCLLAASGEAGSPERILPVYLREPDARRWLERDNRTT